MTPRRFDAVIDGSKLRMKNNADFLRHVRRFKPGEPLQVSVERRYRKRTQGAEGEVSNQNGYYWKCLSIIADEIGEPNVETVHDWLQLALGNVKAMKDGTRVPLGTRHMSVGEFSEWSNKVIQWAETPGNIVEHGIKLPRPDEYEG